MVTSKRKLSWLIVTILLIVSLMDFLDASSAQELKKGYMVIAYPEKTPVNTSVPIIIYIYENSTKANERAKLVLKDLSKKFNEKDILVETETLDYSTEMDQGILMLIADDNYFLVHPPQSFYTNIIRDNLNYAWILTPKKPLYQSLDIRFIMNSENESNEVHHVATIKVGTINSSEIYNYLIYGGLLIAIIGLITAYFKSNKKQ